MGDRFSNWANIPPELRDLPQWCLAGASKAPLGLNAEGKTYHAKVTDPITWMSFDRAARFAYENQDLVTTHVTKEGLTVTQTGLNIGFVLSAADPFTCIDLDVKDPTTHPNSPSLWTTQDDFSRYMSMIREFGSFTETSRSGKGVHIWVRANIGAGFRRGGVEIYSQERFIICTGDGPRTPIREGSVLLAKMVTQMNVITTSPLEELPEVESDKDIFDMANAASNSDKFKSLWEGHWQGMGFPSQSEADLALMSMLTFYSPSNEQCRRLFRMSALGKREKATKDDRYLNFTLTTIRTRESKERAANIGSFIASQQAIAEIQATERQLAHQQIQHLTGVAPHAGAQADQLASRVVSPLHIPSNAPATSAPPSLSSQLALMAPETEEVIEAGRLGIAWPPGMAGQIAKFVFNSSVRPVKEVSIVSTLGLLAGICGKAWCIPESGLNLYVILVARSAVGKEAMHTGISKMLVACAKTNPGFGKYIDFTDYASGPALIKACVANPSFVNVSGEWGRKLQRIAQEDGRADGPMQTLRTQMTNLYQKSGPQSIVGGLGYSATDNNVASIAGVNYSMIGETTPGTFYEALTERMMEDGFLSRFLILDYDGLRPPAQKQTLSEPDEGLVRSVNDLALQADQLILKNYSKLVQATAEVAELIYKFELECDGKINGTKDEAYRQMWNRASLKSLRVAALLAVADNPHEPVIQLPHIEWAQKLIRNDIRIMNQKITGGDVGTGDKSRERKLVAALKDYALREPPASYKIPAGMREKNIIPRSYLQIKTQSVAVFSNHKMGANRALDETVSSMMASGYIMEIEKSALSEAFNFHGKAYRILRLPDDFVQDA